MTKGFTLIELIIVISIVSLSLGAGYVSYLQFSQSSKLKKNAEDFANLLTIAKQRTIRRDMTPDPACSEFGGYEARIINTTTYQLRFICRPGGITNFTIVNPVFTLSPNTIFRTPAPPANVPFYSPYGCVDATYPDSNCSNNTATGTRSIQIQNQQSNRCITIDVNNLGTIDVGEAGPCI